MVKYKGWRVIAIKGYSPVLTMDPKKEREYADEIPDDEETERPDADELTCRDGSLQNEYRAGDEK